MEVTKVEVLRGRERDRSSSIPWQAGEADVRQRSPDDQFPAGRYMHEPNLDPGWLTIQILTPCMVNSDDLRQP